MSNVKSKVDLTAEATPVWLISANDLLMGNVIYFNEASDWSRSLSTALKMVDIETANTLLADIELNQTHIVSPMIVNASLSPEGELMLSHFRDQFRESGPTYNSTVHV